MPTAFSLHYRIQKENATAARLRMRTSKDDEEDDSARGIFSADNEFSFEVSDPLAELASWRSVAGNATRIVADIISNISRVLLAPRQDTCKPC